MSENKMLSVEDLLGVLGAFAKNPLAEITHNGKKIGAIEYIPEKSALVLDLEEGQSLLIAFHVLPLFHTCQEDAEVGLFGLGKDSQPMNFKDVKLYYSNTNSPIIGMNVMDNSVELLVADVSRS